MSLRDRIIHEALGLFSLKGYLSTSIEDIISATSSSKGGLYNHFHSKDDLFWAVLEEARRIWRAKVLQGLREPSSHLDRVRRLLMNYRDLYLRDSDNIPGGCIFVTLSVELDDQRPDFAAEVQKGFTGVKGIILSLLAQAKEAGELRDGVQVEALSEMLFANMVGASVLYAMDKSQQTLDRSFGPLLDYLDSLAA